MALTQFTVTLDQFELGDDAEPLLGSSVVCIPQVTGVALAPDYSPRPASFTFKTVDGIIDSDGQLKPYAAASSVGLRLYANDPLLNLVRLPYKVELRRPGIFQPIWVAKFDAPATDVTVSLVSVLPATGAAAESIRLAVVNDLSDATPVGKAVVRATDEAAARAAIGAGTTGQSIAFAIALG